MKLIIREDLPPEVQFTQNELRILIRAQIICEKADKLLRPGGDSDADYTSFSYASGDLEQVISEVTKG